MKKIETKEFENQIFFKLKLLKIIIILRNLCYLNYDPNIYIYINLNKYISITTIGLIKINNYFNNPVLS